MNPIKISERLSELEQKIGAFTSPQLRADALVSLISIELKNSKKIDLLGGAQQGLTEMFEEINKVDKSNEWNISLHILKNFLASGEFGLIATTINLTDDASQEKFEIINEKLQKIINKYDNDKIEFIS